MIDERNKKVFLAIGGIAFVVFLLVYFGYTSLDGDKSGGTGFDANSLEKIIKDIDVTTIAHKRIPVEINGTDLKDVLPDISKYPPQVKSSAYNYVEIFSSTEKAGSGTDGWLTEVARDFNNAKVMIDG